MPYPVLATCAVPNAFTFRKLTGREELGRPFEYTVELLSKDPALDANKLLGDSLTLHATFPDGREHYFNGDIVEFRQLTDGLMDMWVYEAVLRPKLWFLSFTYDCRIFQNQTARQIIEAILQEHGQTDFEFKVERASTAREYCVQYNESDFAFISRILEEEGYYYYFKHEDKKHTLVICDSSAAHSDIKNHEGGAVLRYQSRRKGSTDDHIDDWTIQRRVRTGAYAVQAYDFQKPKANLNASSLADKTHGHAKFEQYVYPSGHLIVSEGEAIARRRVEEIQAVHLVSKGSTNCPDMGAGVLFEFANYTLRNDQNGRYLTIASNFVLKMEIESSGADRLSEVGENAGLGYQSEFECIPDSIPFRPACTTPQPIVRGPQTAVVVGKAGEEIWTDANGRIKVQFHWDRLGKKDENSSCWLRVAQTWAGKGFGLVQIPRIGEEVIVDFLEGNPDQPIVVGRVYNGDNAHPYALPANATQSGAKSHSSKEGTAENFNELRFEDKKGVEQIYFHAEKNFDRVVENSDTLKVGFEKKDPGDQTIDIYNNRTTTLEKGIDKLQVKEGDRIGLVDKGNDTLTIGEGSQTVTISKGDHTLTVSAGKATLEACSEMLLKVGESTIKITPSSIELTSVSIKISASGNLEAAGAQTKVDGSATLDLNGGVITLN